MSMYAVIKSGGKQYRVKAGDIIDVELLHADNKEIEFADVLFVGDGQSIEVGAPSVADYLVKGEILDEVAGPKITSIKYRPNHNEVRKFGHRQRYNRVKITSIGKKSKKG